MNVYRLGDTDVVIADSVEDAWTVWCEHLGERREDCGSWSWERLPLDEELGIWCGPDGKICEQGAAGCCRGLGGEVHGSGVGCERRTGLSLLDGDVRWLLLPTRSSS